MLFTSSINSLKGKKMNDNIINAHCAICGKGYHVCQDSLDQKTFRPWKTVTDTLEHYKVYAAIHLYTTTHDKNAAKYELEKCDLSELETFHMDIQKIIHEILHENVMNKKNNKQNRYPNKEIPFCNETNEIDE